MAKFQVRVLNPSGHAAGVGLEAYSSDFSKNDVSCLLTHWFLIMRKLGIVSMQCQPLQRLWNPAVTGFITPNIGVNFSFMLVNINDREALIQLKLKKSHFFRSEVKRGAEVYYKLPKVNS